MQLDHAGRSSALMERIDVLRDDRQSLYAISQPSDREMRRVRLGVRETFRARPIPRVRIRKILRIATRIRKALEVLFDQSPSSAPRYVGMPLSADTPAPVKTTTFSCLRHQRCSAFESVFHAGSLEKVRRAGGRIDTLTPLSTPIAFATCAYSSSVPPVPSGRPSSNALAPHHGVIAASRAKSHEQVDIADPSSIRALFSNASVASTPSSVPPATPHGSRSRADGQPTSRSASRTS